MKLIDAYVMLSFIIHSANLMPILCAIRMPNEQVIVLIFQEFVVCRKFHKGCMKVLEKVRESLFLPVWFMEDFEELVAFVLDFKRICKI